MIPIYAGKILIIMLLLLTRSISLKDNKNYDSINMASELCHLVNFVLMINSLDAFHLSRKAESILFLVKVNRSENWRNSRAINRYLQYLGAEVLIIHFCGVWKTFPLYFPTAPTISCQYIEVQSVEFYFCGHLKPHHRLLCCYWLDVFEVLLLDF